MGTLYSTYRLKTCNASVLELHWNLGAGPGGCSTSQLTFWRCDANLPPLACPMIALTLLRLLLTQLEDYLQLTTSAASCGI